MVIIYVSFLILVFNKKFNKLYILAIKLLFFVKHQWIHNDVLITLEKIICSTPKVIVQSAMLTLEEIGLGIITWKRINNRLVTVFQRTPFAEMAIYNFET